MQKALPVLSSRYTTQRGFGIVHVVFMLGIVGLLAGTYFSFYQTNINNKAVTETRLKIDRAMNAISSHTLRFSNLPCPADPSENNAGNFGNAMGCSPSRNGTLTGILPYRTLGLTQDDAKDAYGNYMTYIIARGALQTSANPRLLSSVMCGVLGLLPNVMNNLPAVIQTVLQLLLNNTIPPNTVLRVRYGAPDGTWISLTDNAYVVIISHGANGVGGFDVSNPNAANRSSPKQPVTSLGQWEQQNVVSATLTDSAAATDTYIGDYTTGWNDNNHFDDIVGYKTGPELIGLTPMTSCSATQW